MFPNWSTAVHVTTVTPVGKKSPIEDVQVTVVGDKSIAAGTTHVAVVPPVRISMTMGSITGHTITGGVVSTV